MGDALAGIRKVLAAADDILSDEQGKDQVRRTLANAEGATENLNVAIADLMVVTADLRTFVEEKREPAGEVIDSMAEASASFVKVTEKLSAISTSLDSIVTSVENGEGTLGKLVVEDEAHDEFMAAIKEVRELVARISENPKSFVQFSIF